MSKKRAKTLRFFIVPFALSFFISPLHGALPLGKIPPSIVLEGDHGGLFAGGSWSSDSMLKKIALFIYTTAQDGYVNEEANTAVKNGDFSRSNFQSIGAINMAKNSLWYPASAVAVGVRLKQIEYPRTIYLRDNDRTLSKKWGLSDTCTFTLFDTDGSVLFSVDGKLTHDQLDELMKLIREKTAALEAPKKTKQQTTR